MLSIGKLVVGYLLYVASEFYYEHGGEPPGTWWGSPADHLKLPAIVEREHLENLAAGFSPDGSRALVANAGKATRRPGTDLTFSAPKAVSVLFALLSDHDRDLLMACHHAAVNAALEYLEEHAGRTRLGNGGHRLERCKLLVSQYHHYSARAGDPHTHTHCGVLNLGFRETSSNSMLTSALSNEGFYDHKMAAGALYRSVLAFELQRRLGLQIDQKAHGFTIRGLPDDLVQHFSKRREQIEHELQERGYSTARAAAMATLNTRERKGHAALGYLRDKWHQQMHELGYVPEAVLAGIPRHAITRQSDIDVRHQIRKHAESLAETRASFMKHDLVQAVLTSELLGKVDPKQVLKEIDRFTEDATDVARLVSVNDRGEHTFTTQKQLDRERSVFKYASLLAERQTPWVSKQVAVRTCERNADRLQSPERMRAFEYLVRDPGDAKFCSGYAGVGKSSILKAVREALEKQGYQVHGFAPTGVAARNLEASSGIVSKTVRKRLLELDPSLSDRAQHVATELHRAARFGKYPEYEPSSMERLKPGRKDVFVIDETSMIDSDELKQILRFAHDARAKVILLGDPHQLPAIDSVSPFSALLQNIGGTQLSTIVRQEDKWQKEMVRSFATGDPETGLNLLLEHKRLHVAKGGGDATKTLLIENWHTDTPEIQEKLILASTNKEVDDFNQRAQEVRRAAGALGVVSATLSNGEKVFRGDRVKFRKNNRGLDVSNGDFGTVTHVWQNGFGKKLHVDLDDGRHIRFDLRSYEHLSLGYASTVHASQGSTVESVFVYTTPKHASRELTYVACSRHSKSLNVFCPGFDLGEDLAELQHAMKRSRVPRLAEELRSDFNKSQLKAELERLASLDNELRLQASRGISY